MNGQRQPIALRALLGLASAALLLGCAPRTLAPLDPSHPASPEAAEGEPRAAGTLLEEPRLGASERETSVPPTSHGHPATDGGQQERGHAH